MQILKVLNLKNHEFGKINTEQLINSIYFHLIKLLCLSFILNFINFK